MVALGPVLGGFDDAGFAGGADERGRFAGQAGVAIVELDAAVDHLLLAEKGQLVGAESVDKVVKEGVFACEDVNGGLDPVDRCVVRLCL